MAARKNQNSIIFLTTLGVYLGLVLVGATPVLGHAATSRQFDIRDEIEYSDEFDTKPDAETAGLSGSLKTYLEDVDSFITGLGSLGMVGVFENSANAFEVAPSTLLPCIAGNTVGRYTAHTFKLSNENLRPSPERSNKLLTDGYSVADCLSSRHFPGREATESRFTFKLSEKELSSEVAAGKTSYEAARRQAALLASVRRVLAEGVENTVSGQLLEHTSFRSENDQIFVITRLPRAGLAALFALNAE